MIRNYLKIALRTLLKQKVLASINILGLSIGIACFSLLLLYAVNEFNYDRFHNKANQIYRIYRWALDAENSSGQGDIYLPMPLGPAIKQDIPGVKNFVRMQEAWDKKLIKINQDIFEIPVSFADPSFFEVFSFKLKNVSGISPLKDLHNVVISERTAKTLFGDAKSIGKTIEIKVQDKYEPFVISGVAENPPSNSSINFDILASFEYLATTRNGARSVGNWERSSYLTYLEFDAKSKIADNKTLQEFYTKYHLNEEAEMRQKGEWKGEGSPTTYGLQALKGIHTDTQIGGGRIGAIDTKNIWILVGIACGILLIACINFTTLAIGRSVGRAKEVGIRKMIGSTKKGLMIQFISEALLLSILSAIIGLALGVFLLPYFNELSGRELVFSFQEFPEYFWLMTIVSISAGLLAGLYPAVTLAFFNPLDVLKQKIRVGGANYFTKSLITFQFVLSIGLIASTIFILQQINYMADKNLGFNKANIVVINADKVDNKIYPLFKRRALSQSQVDGIAGANLGLGEGGGFQREGFQFNGKHKDVYTYNVDDDFMKVLGIKLLAGDGFDSKNIINKTSSIIINEAMMKDFGWTLKNAVGQKLKELNEANPPIVIGVVKNFNYRSLREEVMPQFFHQFTDNAANRYYLKLKPGNPSTTLSLLNAEWKGLVPEIPFRYSFLDKDFERLYKEEKRLGSTFSWAGIISIFLACLGLFGLAALSAINRIKEIGIRKVLGATIINISGLLSKDFLILVGVSILISSPIVYYFMQAWLQDFAYRIEISWWIFVITGIGALGITLLTVSYQAVKAALMNPIKSLKTE